MIELLCTDYNKKATSIHYYFGNAVLVRRIRRQGIKAVFNEGGKQYQWEIPLKLIDKIAPGDRVVVETFYGPQRVTVKEIIPLAKRTGRKVRRIEEKEN